MRFAPLVLAALCVAVLFTGLHLVGYTDDREARDAEVAREMIVEREPLTPIFGRIAWFEKPILAYAPEVLVRLLSSGSPARSRQMRAGLMVALVLLTASVAGRHFGTRAAWCSAGALVTALVVPLAARTDGTQILGSLFGWVGCAGLVDVVFGRPAGRELRLVVAYGALATALMVAGPLPALWPLGGLALYCALARDRASWRRARPLAGAAILIGVGLPWYGALTERYGAAFLSRAPFFPYAAEARGAWYAGPVLAISSLVMGFFPWSALLPAATLHAATWWRLPRAPLPRRANPPPATHPLPDPDPIAREWREEAAAHCFIACLCAALVPIAIYPSPPLPAVLPALPAAALLVGRFIDHLFEAPERVARPFSGAVRMLAVVGTGGAFLLSVMASRLRPAAPDLRLLASLLFVTSWAPSVADFAGRRRLAAVLVALPVGIGAPIASTRLLPAIEDYLNTGAVARAMAAASPPHASLVLLEPAPPSLRLATRRNLVLGDPLDRTLQAQRASDGFAYVAFRPAREAEMLRAAQAPIEILLRTPTLVLARVHRD
jgi:4-amino-4-deoxy-L-arabinose transferase-like glycosyltransferase